MSRFVTCEQEEGDSRHISIKGSREPDDKYESVIPFQRGLCG